MGAYSRWALIRGWALIKFSPISASVVCLFCCKAINANNKTPRSNKARFSIKYSQEKSVLEEVSYLYLLNFNFNLIVTQVGGVGVGTYLSLIGRRRGCGSGGCLF